jgi:hypothetical protein
LQQGGYGVRDENGNHHGYNVSNLSGHFEDDHGHGDCVGDRSGEGGRTNHSISTWEGLNHEFQST